MKKILSFLITLSMVFSMSIGVFAEDSATTETTKFTDVDSSSTQGQAIYKLVQSGILCGYGDNTFRPGNSLTRAELCKIINLAFNYTEADEKNFSDVKKEDWFYPYVAIAKKAGYIKGHEDGTFRGNDYLTREEACVVICRVAGLYDIPFTDTIKDEISDWAVPYVHKVLASRIMNLEADGSFRATSNITRGELTVSVSYFVQSSTPEDDKQEEDKKDDETKEENNNSTVGGGTGGGGTGGGGTGGGTGGNTGGSTGGSTGGNTDDNQGSTDDNQDNTDDNQGSTGDDQDNTDDNQGDTGGNTGSGTGGSTGGNTGEDQGNTDDNQGDTGGNTGSGTGGNTGEDQGNTDDGNETPDTPTEPDQPQEPEFDQEKQDTTISLIKQVIAEIEDGEFDFEDYEYAILLKIKTVMEVVRDDGEIRNIPIYENNYVVNTYKDEIDLIKQDYNNLSTSAQSSFKNNIEIYFTSYVVNELSMILFGKTPEQLID